VNTPPAVEVHDLVKRYGRITAVDGLSLSAERGAVTAVLGPNGAGKTSTVEICEGYRRPDAGTVSVLGLDPVADARRLRPRVGVMLQSGGIPPAVRPGEYLRVMASFHAHPLNPADLLDRLGLASSGSRSPPPSSAARSWFSSTSPRPAWTRRHATPPGI
jgi:ABC-2 type transport system ATP-binding protein